MDETARHSWIIPIPYVILADNTLTPLARLIAAEIFSLLTYETPFCFASNKYFAKLFSVSEWTVSKAISSLVAKGYFAIEIEQESGNKRKILPSSSLLALKRGIEKNHKRSREKSQEGYSKKSHTENVNIENNKDTNVSLSSTEDGGRYGNKKVNFLLEEFERRYDYPPTDRKPRYEAWVLARKIDAWIKSYGREPTDELFVRAATALYNWIESQDWGENVQYLGTIRRKSVMLLKPKKEVKDDDDEQKPTQV